MMYNAWQALGLTALRKDIRPQRPVCMFQSLLSVMACYAGTITAVWC